MLKIFVWCVKVVCMAPLRTIFDCSPTMFKLDFDGSGSYNSRNHNRKNASSSYRMTRYHINFSQQEFFILKWLPFVCFEKIQYISYIPILKCTILQIKVDELMFINFFQIAI